MDNIDQKRIIAFAQENSIVLYPIVLETLAELNALTEEEIIAFLECVKPELIDKQTRLKPRNLPIYLRKYGPNPNLYQKCKELLIQKGRWN